jgi:hypothetical protein
MMRSLARSLIAAAAFLAGAAVAGASEAASSGGAAQMAVAMPAALLSVDPDQPIERRVSDLAKSTLRTVRWSFRMLRSMFWKVVDWWGRWAKRAAFSLGVAVIAALADGGLVNAWRAEGLRTLMTYSALMLYVYARLLFSAGVNLVPKLLLIAALIYGVVRRDFVWDKSFVPGRIDDIVLIIVATRAFVYACPEELVDQYAERAVNLKRRMMGLPRAEPR